MAFVCHLVARKAYRQPRIAKRIIRVPGGGGAFGRGAAQHGLDTRHQLLGLKGLGHIIIRAQFQSQHLVEGFVARSEHDDGHLAGLADLLEHLQAVHAGQHHVQQDQSRRFALESLQRLVSAGGFGYGKAFLFQIEPHQVADVGVVIYQQDALLFRHRL